MRMTITIGLILAAACIAAQADVVVSDSSTGKILKYNATTGAYIGEFADVTADGYSAPTRMEVGPDGNLYVMVSEGIARYDATTGSHVDQLTTTAVPTAAGNWLKNAGMAIDPGTGRVFVGGNPYNDGTFHPAPVYAIDPVTKVTTQFYEAPDNDGGVRGLMIGYQGDLYVYDENSGPNDLRRVDITTGANVAQTGTYWHTGMANSWDSDIAFANGTFFWMNMVNTGDQSVEMNFFPEPAFGGVSATTVESYSGTVGGRLEDIAGGPDGNLYWTFDDPDASGLTGIKRYDTATPGVSMFITSAGELTDPRGIAWLPTEVIPEPATLSLITIGALGMIVRRKRR